jgi:hypothetical protein
MNSNIFTNALLMPQESSPNEFSEESPFTSWNTSNELPLGSGFQADGPLSSNLFPQNPMSAANAPALPPGLVAAITAAISQYLAQGAGNSGGYSQGGAYGTATPFQTVTLGSTGDPHEAIDGTRTDGTSVKRNWNSMQSHPDLLSAPGVAGGFQLSSQVGAQNAQGATMNASVVATADHGRTAISFNANGDASVRQGANVTQLTPNETIQFGPGLSVTDTGNALRITAQDAGGSILTTTLSKNGQGGVDVNAQGENIALGGYLVNSSSL